MHKLTLPPFRILFNKNHQEKILFAVFFITFFLESIGIPFIFTSVAGSIATIALVKKIKSIKQKQLSKKSLILGLLFLSIIISTITSMNPQRSIITIGVVFLILMTVLFLRQTKSLSRFLYPSIIAMGVLLCLYSSFLVHVENSFIPSHGYQLVFSRFGAHNHLGDFLLLPIILCSYYLIHKKNKLVYLLLLLFFIPYFLLSYSRSAYLSLIITLIIFSFTEIKTIKNGLLLKYLLTIISGGLVTVLSLFFFATVFEFKNVSYLAPLNQLLVENFGLTFKHFGANRLEYANTAIQSIKEKPLFGVGPGNFVYASAKYSNIPNYRTHSSHNLLLDLSTEFGLIVIFLLFIVIGYLVLENGYAPKMNWYLILPLLINFYFDYSFKIAILCTLTLLFISKSDREIDTKGG